MSMYKWYSNMTSKTQNVRYRLTATSPSAGAAISLVWLP